MRFDVPSKKGHSSKIPPLPQGYRALSSVWGDPKDTVPIIIVEGDTLFAVYITRNLFAAITDLRRPTNLGAPNIATPPDEVYRFPNLGTDLLCLWVDAFCIDQSNGEEKSMQVQIMGEIYARSCGVLIWLGDGAGKEATVKILDTMLNKKTYLWPPSIADGVAHNSWVKVPDIYSALKELFLLPWWSRIWVIFRSFYLLITDHPPSEGHKFKFFDYPF
jgi:hypothetical protein